MITPATAEELADAVRDMPRVLVVGAGTKPRLSAVDVPKISTAKLNGILEYEPEEFTITAKAGTPLREITAVLAERGQYLPFDPMLMEAGATLGGTVAAGLNGPGRFRYGGLRDFILGVRFVDGTGRLLRLGGKVVKNAAGFDVPKFMVGSLGRFGAVAELTFKVFPRPPASLTIRITAEDAAAAVQVLTASANSRWEPDALDVLPDGHAILLRLAGPAAALDLMACEVLARWPGVVLTADEALRAWAGLAEFRWAPGDAALVKVPVTPDRMQAVDESLSMVSGIRLHVSAGGNVAYLSATDVAAIDEQLQALGLAGMTLRGAAPLWLGKGRSSKVAAAVKEALDPHHRFPSLED